MNLRIADGFTVFRMIFGYVYPAYECFKTLERNKPDIEQLRFWCQYWYIGLTRAVIYYVGHSILLVIISILLS